MTGELWFHGAKFCRLSSKMDLYVHVAGGAIRRPYLTLPYHTIPFAVIQFVCLRSRVLYSFSFGFGTKWRVPTEQRKKNSVALKAGG